MATTMGRPTTMVPSRCGKSDQTERLFGSGGGGCCCCCCCFGWCFFFCCSCCNDGDGGVFAIVVKCLHQVREKREEGGGVVEEEDMQIGGKCRTETKPGIFSDQLDKQTNGSILHASHRTGTIKSTAHQTRPRPESDRTGRRHPTIGTDHGRRHTGIITGIITGNDKDGG